MIKRLAGCIRQYKRDTVLTPLFMLGEVSCECVIPLLTAELINNIQAGCSMNVILQFGLKLFLVAMLSLACGSASGAGKMTTSRPSSLTSCPAMEATTACRSPARASS